MNGLFYVPLDKHRVAACLVSDGEGWQHCSVHGMDIKENKQFTLNWNQMCAIKDVFWDEDEWVVQYHPKVDYVNIHPHVLHLWKPTVLALPIPPTIMV
jgi:hypothetical protein